MNRKVLLISVGATVGLAVLWFLLLWTPQGGRLTDAHEREETAAATNSQLELRAARLAAAEQRRPELTADLEALRVAVPDAPDLAQFLLDADTASTAAGVDFISISPTPPAASTTAGVPSEIALSISVEGGYFQVLDFLNRLSSMPRIVVVDTLGLTASGEGSDAVLTVAITARMFTTAADVAAPVPGAAVDPAAPTTTTIVPSPPTTEVAAGAPGVTS